MSQYKAPLDVTMSHDARKRVFVKQRVTLATKHAERAAKTYTKVLLRICDETHDNPIERAGGKEGIVRTMQREAVHKPLREYAADLVLRLLKEKPEGVQ